MIMIIIIIIIIIIVTIKGIHYKMEAIFMILKIVKRMNHTDSDWIWQISLILKILRKI